VSGAVQAIPGLRAIAHYDRSCLRNDIVAGLVLTALLVPQGMAYAELAGLPTITGLYTTILALAAYALFGPSRILVLGPDSSLGPMIAARSSRFSVRAATLSGRLRWRRCLR
jgi:MFS superfamily sulfate permease-like transporter